MKMLATLPIIFLFAAAAPEPRPDAWLQQRLDRILVAAGQSAGSIEAHWSSTEDLRLEQRGAVVAIPQSLVATAPSEQALDGVLSMVVAYQRQDARAKRGPSAGEVAAVVALTALTGGATDGQSSNTKFLPIVPDGMASRDVDFDAARRRAAWRGARWNVAVGGCTRELVAFLRHLATNPAVILGGKNSRLVSAEPARRILRDMGTLASPSDEPCAQASDPTFRSFQEKIKA
ncbi:hypothetical protein [Sphingomonas sp. GB1N7]|uniref:hypothetical protein n=1 Tax=Parasphingomonas caseinilytica TaxID=3096158 RepID=UPI002FC753FA